MKLEDLQPNTAVKGILADSTVTGVNVQWFGSAALELTYKTPTGKVANELLYRDDEARLAVVEVGRPWSLDGDGALFRLVSEAQRIRLAHLFDPVLAVHTSVVDPLPHQITAVYESMLSRQPLRFLLADDPGAGKTIMAGLLIKELMARGDLERCLVVCPGSLAEQWQGELYRRFQLPFEILTNDKLEAARTGNWFLETPLVIARLDKLSRDEDVQAKLGAPDCGWDLVVCDEAHKLSATFFGGEIRYTKRYRLGQLLSGLTRHFLLMTATPHNGKEEDFQLFMALLDGDRFEGRFRDGVHVTDVADALDGGGVGTRAAGSEPLPGGAPVQGSQAGEVPDARRVPVGGPGAQGGGDQRLGGSLGGRRAPPVDADRVPEERDRATPVGRRGPGGARVEAERDEDGTAERSADPGGGGGARRDSPERGQPLGDHGQEGRHAYGRRGRGVGAPSREGRAQGRADSRPSARLGEPCAKEGLNNHSLRAA